MGKMFRIKFIFFVWCVFTKKRACSPESKFKDRLRLRGLSIWCLTPLSFQQYFSYNRGNQFYWRKNWSTQRKPPTCHKSLINYHNYKVVPSIPCHDLDSKIITLMMMIGTDCIASCYSNYHMTMKAPRVP